VPPIDPLLLTALRAVRRVVVFTGAGVSAESGIPTFRDKQTGLWEHFDAAELATPHAFERDPALVWGWYEWRRAMVSDAQPNPVLADRDPIHHPAPFSLVGTAERHEFPPIRNTIT
jgi:NAD-dependent deacetylase